MKAVKTNRSTYQVTSIKLEKQAKVQKLAEGKWYITYLSNGRIVKPQPSYAACLEYLAKKGW